MRVIMTGGTGLIGRELTESLVNDKYEVIVLSRNPDWVVGIPAGAQVVGWDGKSAVGWGHLADGAGAIINLAGESIAGNIPLGTRWTTRRKKAILTSRVNAGIAVVEAISAAKVKPDVVVQSSAVGYYGGFAGSDRLTEDSPNGKDFLANVCLQWEDSSKPVEALGVRRVIVRTALVMSTKDGILPWMALPFRFFVGGKIGSGKQYVHWIHVADEVGAIRFLIDNETAEGVYNLCAPQSLPNQEFAMAIGAAMGRPSFFPMPGFVFKIAFGEASTLLLEGQNVIPARIQSAGYEFKFSEAKPALLSLFLDEKNG